MQCSKLRRRLPLALFPLPLQKKKWAEREASFVQQLAQLQALVGQGGSDAASEAAPSEAADVAPAEQLVDDEVWAKVDRGKRRALLRREREVLATKVRTSLGKVKASTSSPFKRHAA